MLHPKWISYADWLFEHADSTSIQPSFVHNDVRVKVWAIVTDTNMHAHSVPATTVLPAIMVVAEAEYGLLLVTVQVYTPPVVTVRVWVYCAVTGSS